MHTKFPGYKWYFYADYDLGVNGDGYLSSGDTVFFLRMTYKGYHQVSFVLRPSPSTIGAYERIGLGRYIKNIETIHLEGFDQEEFSLDEVEC
jgi:hypothetical protein